MHVCTSLSSHWGTIFRFRGNLSSVWHSTMEWDSMILIWCLKLWIRCLKGLGKTLNSMPPRAWGNSWIPAILTIRFLREIGKRRCETSVWNVGVKRLKHIHWMTFSFALSTLFLTLSVSFSHFVSDSSPFILFLCSVASTLVLSVCSVTQTKWTDTDPDICAWIGTLNHTLNPGSEKICRCLLKHIHWMISWRYIPAILTIRHYALKPNKTVPCSEARLRNYSFCTECSCVKGTRQACQRNTPNGPKRGKSEIYSKNGSAGPKTSPRNHKMHLNPPCW